MHLLFLPAELLKRVFHVHCSHCPTSVPLKMLLLGILKAPVVPGLMDPHIQPPAVYLRFNRSKTRSMGPTLSLPSFGLPATTILLVESQTQETLLISPCPLRLTHLNNQKVPLELPPKYFLNLPIYCLLSLHCPLIRANHRPHCSGPGLCTCHSFCLEGPFPSSAHG